MGMRMRLTMNPGRSTEEMSVLPRCAASVVASSAARSLVAMPLTSSTNGIAGTGFMKCMPTTHWGLAVAAPMRVMEMEDVFDASVAPAGAMRSSWEKMDFFKGSDSGVASMMKSDACRACEKGGTWGSGVG